MDGCYNITGVGVGETTSIPVISGQRLNSFETYYFESELADSIKAARCEPSISCPAPPSSPPHCSPRKPPHPLDPPARPNPNPTPPAPPTSAAPNSPTT